MGVATHSVYLDSSAIVKRYVREPGSDAVRRLFLRAYSGECTLAYSVWNIGEVLGAFDRARNAGMLDQEGHSAARRRFASETQRTMRLRIATAVPIRNRILMDAWRLTEAYHIYDADALQIATAKHAHASSFLSGDHALHNAATAEGLNSQWLH
ncbi:MAG TPA: type II toxin-antitoxin system VapC family toxin [Candidatus Methanomethylicus sp.]|jgi:predicted nucleic acid-binding protein|nr:type II toxin-antitoxin system VapC family toxin [Candidatus Methanomethylicus sp.]